MNKLLHVSYPRGCEKERLYILRWLFDEVYGVSCELKEEECSYYKIRCAGAEGEVTLPDVFFRQARERWLSSSTLPDVPLPETSGGLPMLYGLSDSVPGSLSRASDSVMLQLDVFGSLFFLLSGYEEYLSDERDHYDRFFSGASILGKCNLLERPIGNEYIEYLWETMFNLWPFLERTPRRFQMRPSHDVDWPSDFWLPGLKRRVKRSGKRLLTTGIPAIAEGLQRFCYPIGGWNKDPFDTVDWIMDQSEQAGCQSSFYYIPEKTHDQFDAGMPLDHPHVIDQWKRIYDRGHEIGLHPGFDTYQSPQKIARGADLIRALFLKHGIDQKLSGGRQHFLKWCANTTARAWESAGLDYDSTLGFADHAGFRCGVCYEFPMYDLEERRPMGLKQRPLVVMDCSVVDARYQNLGLSEAAFDYIMALKRQCMQYDGMFTILWHNNRFERAEEREFYSSILLG